MDTIMKKLEQMDPDERNKLRNLLKDKDKGEEMTWMYKADKPDTEEYLLGRRVDKHIEEQDEVPQDDDAPGALFSEVIAKRADLDMHAKMREDPLFAIRAKEEESRRKLLQNPIKMKQLQKIIKKNEERKNKKKKKKHKKQDSDSSDDSDILSKYLAIIKKKKGSAKMDIESLKKVLNESDSEKAVKTHKKKKEKSKSQHRKKGKQQYESDSESESDRKHLFISHSKAKRHDSSDDEQEEAKPFGLIVKGNHSKRHKTPEMSHRERISKRRSRSPQRRSRSPRQRSRSLKRRSRSPHQRSGSHKSRTSQSSTPPRRDRRSPPQKKLSAEEMEQKRREMMENAKWRDDKRAENVKRYKEEDRLNQDKEENKAEAPAFLNPLLVHHASQSSVADRIKRNIYHVQRTKADQEKSFAKR